MKKITLLFAFIFCLFSCSKDGLVNDNFDVYGYYTTTNSSQLIQAINFNSDYVHVWYIDSSEQKITEYTIVDSKVLDDNLGHRFDIIEYDKNNSIELYYVETMENMVFEPRK